MNLVIDIGNSKTKLAVFVENEPVFYASRKQLGPTFIEKLSPEYQITHAIVSTVKPISNVLNKYLNHHFNFLELNHETPLPLTLEYETPETLGKDRIASAVGALEHSGGANLLVIDAGTCITYDIITAKHAFLGGQISPGINMRYKALNTFTGRLPLIPGTEKPMDMGRSTKGSIQSGVHKGILFEMRGFIDYYLTKYSPLKIILTGGDLKIFESQFKNEIFALPNLVLSGLNKILIYNVDSAN